MKKLFALSTPFVFALILAGCGSGSSSNNSADTPVTIPVVAQAELCAAPRPAGTIDPLTGVAYGDVPGTLNDEMKWIAYYVNQTYLWYGDVVPVSPASYFIGATVPYVDPSDNTASTEKVTSNYMVVDAYFNSQRSTKFTASGKPLDQFHFTYQTTDYVAQTSQGVQLGFGFEVALLSASPPRQALVAYVEPGSPAAVAGIVRGTQFISINGVDVANGTDLTTLNDGLFTPVTGTTYNFVVQIPGVSGQTQIPLTPANITSTPVMNVTTLPAPNNNIGYILYTDQIATAESELIDAVNQLQAANGGAGITDLVLDLRYNGGGYLDLASELAYMIAGPGPTTGKFFEQDTYNNKNPFGLTTAQATVPFHSTAQGFSATTGQPLPQLNLSTLYVITSAGTCSASEAIINGLRGVGVKVVQIGETTCGKPYGFYPQDNCGTTYFAIQFKGVNYQNFGDYADGFIPGGTGTTANNLPGCAATDDFTKQLGDPAEASLATTLYYKNNNGACPSPALGMSRVSLQNRHAGPVLHRSPIRENRILRPISNLPMQ